MQHLCLLPTKDKKVAEKVLKIAKSEYKNIELGFYGGGNCYEILIIEKHPFTFVGLRSLSGFCRGACAVLLSDNS